MNGYGVMFHHFCSSDHPRGQGAITADEFEQILDYLQSKPGVEILPAHDWLEKALARSLKPDQVCLTFDDGLRCQWDIAFPVLQARKLTAFWFIYTTPLVGGHDRLELYRYYRTTEFSSVDEFYCAFFQELERCNLSDRVGRRRKRFNPCDDLERYPFYTRNDVWFRFVRDKVLKEEYHNVMDHMLSSWKEERADEIRQLWMDAPRIQELEQAGHKIGLHSHTHPTDMREKSKEDQAKEYRCNYQHLTQILREPPVVMSHPCDYYNKDTLSVLRDLGIQLGFRASMKKPTGWPLEIPRKDHANIRSEIVGCPPLRFPNAARPASGLRARGCMLATRHLLSCRPGASGRSARL